MRQAGTHAAMLLAGLGLGIGAVAAAGTGQPAARSAAADTRIVRELKQVEKRLDLVNKNLGGYYTIAPDPSVKDYLQNIDRNIAAGP